MHYFCVDNAIHNVILKTFSVGSSQQKSTCMHVHSLDTLYAIVNLMLPSGAYWNSIDHRGRKYDTTCYI